MSALAKEDWRTPKQAELVEDRARHWQAQVFRPSDAVAFPQEGGTVTRQKRPDESPIADGQVVPDGWDHEHCALCWQTISLLTGDQARGYCDGRDWLCTDCYEHYILPRLAEA
jgi:hypothetical protein